MVTIVILILTLIATWAIALASIYINEYHTKPVVGIGLTKTDSKRAISITMTNFSNSDAEGKVILKLYVNDNQYTSIDEAYAGKYTWYFPAQQFVSGFGKLANLFDSFPENMVGKLIIEARVYYWRWEYNANLLTKLIFKNKKYSAPIKRWEYDSRLNDWIPIIAFKERLLNSDI